MHNSEFGERLKKLRADKAKRLGRRKISQREIAEHFNITPGAYGSWETGRTRPDLSQLPTIADYFEVSTDFLLGHRASIPGLTTKMGLVWSLRRSALTENEQKGLKVWQLLTQGKSLETIAAEIGIPRWEKKVECYLEDIMDTDIVSIDYVPQAKDLGEQVREVFGLKEVLVVSTFERSPYIFRNILLGEMSRSYFKKYVHEGTKVGLAGGSSVGRMIYSIRRGECPRIEVYSLANSPIVLESPHLDANTLVRTLAYRHRGYGVVDYSLPYVSPKDWDKLENRWVVAHTRHILQKARGVDIVFMGLGALKFKLASIDLLSGTVSNEEIKRRGAIGDILYHFVDQTGQPIYPEISDLICAINLRDLQDLIEEYGKRVVVIASGREKVEITRVAIRKRYANVLIIDDELAQALLNISKADFSTVAPSI